MIVTCDQYLVPPAATGLNKLCNSHLVADKVNLYVQWMLGGL